MRGHDGAEPPARGDEGVRAGPDGEPVGAADDADHVLREHDAGRGEGDRASAH